MCVCVSVCHVQESQSHRDKAPVGDVSRLQTSDQMPGRRLQLGSWGESAELFIVVMGCHL